MIRRFSALLLAAAAASPLFAQDDMMGAGAAKYPPVVHDPAYFRDRVLPVLAQQCLGCHDAKDPANESRHRLAAPGPDGKWTEEDVRANYEMVRGLASADSPERSLVLSKLVPVSRGGVDHDGGKADDVEIPAKVIDPQGPLVSWLFGATPADAPPVAAYAPVPRQVTLGEEVRLDATLSSDPEGKPLSFTWEIADAPQGARAKPSDPRAKTTTITPDKEGPWVVRLRVRDGALRGWPVTVRFAAARKTEAPGATAAPVAADAIPTADRRATRSLYLDLWGRTPTDEELARAAALPWEKRVDALLDTDETWRTWLDEEAFYFLLIDQFRPVSDRVAAVPSGMRAGRTSFRDAHLAVALSTEFNARNPGNDTYCTVVFEQFLGIEVQKNVKLLETAKKVYDGKQERIFNAVARNQSDIVQLSLQQKSYYDLFTKRMAIRYLGAELPKAEHEATAAMLAAQPGVFRQVLRDWLLSDRYTSPARPPRAKSDHQFIRSLFVDLIGRPPAYEEFRNMRNALQALADPTPVRGVLAKVLLDSSAAVAPRESPHPDRYPGDRFRPAVVELFRRLLGRDPSTEETDAFVTVLLEPGATWRTAALAILTSGQYGTY